MATPKSKNGKPEIADVSPQAAIAGGEVHIHGRGFLRSARPRVTFGDVQAPIVVGSDALVIARVPENASVGEFVLSNGDASSAPWSCDIGIQIADSLHPVTNPAVDPSGVIYTTFSGSRGQKTPVSLYRIDLNYSVTPFLNDIMNPTGLAIGRDGMLYISSRFNGMVYQASPGGNMSVYAEGMGVATGLAFDAEDNLYVGDRSGTIFKIARDRQIYVFATLEPSIAAYHLAFGPGGDLFVTGPTTSSYDSIYRITPKGEVSVFHRGLGRPQGLAFDEEGNLYVAASLGGRKGVVRFDPAGDPKLFLSGPNIVGLAFTPSRAVLVATNSAIYRVDVDVKGLLLS